MTASVAQFTSVAGYASVTGFRSEAGYASVGAAATAVPVTYATWNPADKGAGVSLSNGNLTLTNVTDGIARSTVSKSSGKWFWELSVNGNSGPDVGIATSAATLVSYLGTDAFGYSFYGTGGGQKANNNVFSAYGANILTGDVVGVALDLDAGTLIFYKNGVSLGTAFTGISGTFFAAAGAAGGPVITANFGATPFAFTVPSGYNAGLYS